MSKNTELPPSNVVGLKNCDTAFGLLQSALDDAPKCRLAAVFMVDDEGRVYRYHTNMDPMSAALYAACAQKLALETLWAAEHDADEDGEP